MRGFEAGKPVLSHQAHQARKAFFNQAGLPQRMGVVHQFVRKIVICNFQKARGCGEHQRQVCGLVAWAVSRRRQVGRVGFDVEAIPRSMDKRRARFLVSGPEDVCGKGKMRARALQKAGIMPARRHRNAEGREAGAPRFQARKAATPTRVRRGWKGDGRCLWK